MPPFLEMLVVFCPCRQLLIPSWAPLTPKTTAAAQGVAAVGAGWTQRLDHGWCCCFHEGPQICVWRPHIVAGPSPLQRQPEALATPVSCMPCAWTCDGSVCMCLCETARPCKYVCLLSASAPVNLVVGHAAAPRHLHIPEGKAIT